MELKSTFIVSQIRLVLKQYGYTAGAILLAGSVSGCALFESKVTDPSDVTKQVTREGLDTSSQIAVSDIQSGFAALDSQYAGLKKRADQLAIKYKTAYEQIDQKDQTRIQLLGVISNVANSIPTPYGGVAASVLGLLTTGFALDNRRKDKQIAQRDTNLETLQNLGTGASAAIAATPAGPAIVLPSEVRNGG